MIKTVISEDDLIMFAPEYFYDGAEYLFVTCGEKSKRIYVEKDWGNNRKEQWYKNGSNSFCCYQKGDDGEFTIYNEKVIDTNEFDDVMKLSVIKHMGKLHMWFSGLKENIWNIYYYESEQKLGKNELISSQAIKEIDIKDSNSGEVHCYLPCVIYDGNYKMWYVSRDKQHRRIFYAESQNGVNWDNNQLVLDIGMVGAGDRYAADCPDVVKCNGEYICFYGGGTSRGIHLALSKDGIQWKRKGLIIPRGGIKDESYNYSFYPTVAWNGRNLSDCNHIKVYYSGEDINNNWSILCMQENTFDIVYETDLISDEEAQKVYVALKKIPGEYMLNQKDCNTLDFYYQDDGFMQLRPSTMPIFLLKDRKIVVKVFNDRVKAENEYRARICIKDRLNCVPVQLKYYEDCILVFSPYVENAVMLNNLYKDDIKEFNKVFVTVFSKCVNILKNNALADYLGKLQYTEQTPELLLKWCDEIESSFKNVVIISENSQNKYSICDEIRMAKEQIKLLPKQCSLFSGDINLHNIVYSNGEHFFLDFEYWGYFDIDYILAKIIGSLCKHCDVFRVENYNVLGNDICIKYEIDTEVKEIMSWEFYKNMLDGIPYDLKRIKSYILAKLYFRFMMISENVFDEYVSVQLAKVVGILDFFSEDKR